MDTVQTVPVSWLWRPYVAREKVTLFEGDPGVGKSWTAAALAAGVSRGVGLPGTEQCEPENVLYLTAEDSLGDTLRPRLDAMGADVSRVHAVEGPAVLDSNGLEIVEGFINEVRPALVILDPLVAYISGDVDIHRANQVRQVMAALADLAARYGSAMLAIRHLTKASTDRAIYRGIGSIDFSAAARSVLLVGTDPEDSSKRAIVQTKNNLTAFGPPIGYAIEDGTFRWTGASDLTEDAILASGARSSDRSSLQEAVDFLELTLAEGPVPVKEVQRAAADLGIAVKSTLKRAAVKLEVVSVPVHRANRVGVQEWQWMLPVEFDLGDHPSTD
jgi:hypothetical protein